MKQQILIFTVYFAIENIVLHATKPKNLEAISY